MLAPGGAALGAAIALFFAAIGAIWMWGFTVDDALIPVRYARHLAAGEGYRFNAGGPVTDGVTPLPWAFLLTPLAGRGADALDVLVRAKCINLAAWLAAAGAWGAAVARADAPRAVKGAAFAALVLCVPVAAHAVSGLETGVATALATLAALAWAHPLRAAALAGLAAALRPEMAPWALALSVGLALGAAPAPPPTPARAARTRGLPLAAAALALAPFALCAAARVAFFGRAAPLAALAKPSDLAHGVAYAAAAALATGGPLFALAPLALRRAPHARAIALAGLAHFVALAAAGGDWMPYARLAAPVAPSLLYAGVLAARHARAWATAARAASALALEGYVAVVAAPAGRHVMGDRAALVAAARPYFRGAERVASLDAGWPSAVSEVEIVDLAGVTDPEIAVLPGGHTSKKVGPAMLLARDPDLLLLYAERDAGVDAAHLDGWAGVTYARAIETRLAREELVQTHFTPLAFLPLGDRGAGYVVLRRSR